MVTQGGILSPRARVLHLPFMASPQPGGGPSHSPLPGSNKRGPELMFVFADSAARLLRVPMVASRPAPPSHEGGRVAI